MRQGLTTVAAVLWLVACGADPQAPPDTCAQVDCSGHGVCVDLEGSANCQCETGWQAAGLECVAPTVQVEIVSVQVEPEAVTEGETAILTLALSGPSDDENPLDAAYLQDLGAVKVADFAFTGVPRTYVANVSWAKLHALDNITFLQDMQRSFTVTAQLPDGTKLSKPVDVGLTCGGSGACNGQCRPEMVVDSSISFASFDDCAQLDCNDQALWPLECMNLPLAWLWMTDDQLKKLMSDVMADIEVDATFYFLGQCMDVGVEIHGGLARKFDKKALKLKFNRDDGWFPLDPFSSSAGEPVYDPVGFKQMIFKAHWVDPSLMRDLLTHDHVALAGGLAPRVTHVDLLLNGGYHGVYALTEAVLKDFFLRMGMTGKGNLYKAVNHNAHFGVKADPMAGYEKKTNKTGGSDDLAELFETIAAAPLQFDAFEEKVGQALDLDLYFAFTLVNAFTNNQDSFTKNYYLYREKGASSSFIIVNWDADATWGLNWDGKLEPVDAGGLWGSQNYLSAKLKKIPEYKDHYSTTITQAMDNMFSPEQTAQRIQAVAQKIAPDIRFEECRWEKDTTFDEHLDIILNYTQLRRAYWLPLLTP